MSTSLSARVLPVLLYAVSPIARKQSTGVTANTAATNQEHMTSQAAAKVCLSSNLCISQCLCDIDTVTAPPRRVFCGCYSVQLVADNRGDNERLVWAPRTRGGFVICRWLVL